MTKLCECGCGQPVKIAQMTDNRRGYVKGQPRRFVAGHMSQEIREAIGRSHRERHRRNNEQLEPRPKHKRCSECKKMKRVPEDYYMATRKNAAGEKVKYPPGRCAECSRKRKAAWKERMEREQPGELARRQARYNRNRRRSEQKVEELRRKQREWSRAARERAGAKVRGPWKKYRKREGRVLVDAELFFEWMHWVQPKVTESERRRIDAVRSEAEPGLEIGLIDRIMARYGATDQFHIFYGDAQAIQDDAA